MRRCHNPASLRSNRDGLFMTSSEEPPVEVPMRYSQSPPLAAKEPTASSDGPARNSDARSNQRVDTLPIKSSVHQIARNRPSIGRRIFRSLAGFWVAVLIGIGGTLAWQSYGDAARETLAARAPTLAWMLSTAKSAAAAATSPDPVQQLEPLASNLDAVRRSVEQLAARQEQMVQNIATLQAVEEDIRQKMSSPPSSPSQQAAPIPQHAPPKPKAQSSAVQSSSVPRPPPPAGPLVLSH